MGIPGLWKIIEEQETQVVTTLEDRAAGAKETHNAQGTGPFHLLVVGVDTPVLMSQCTAGTYGANHFNGMVPLEIFFYKLCRLSQSWCNIIFVFDGPKRPNIKRGHNVPVENEVDWYGPCQKIIKDFKYHVHMAPGEAEAELAALNERGMIDIILTGDCDTFVFGAKSVFRSTTVKRSPSPTHNPDIFALLETSGLIAKEPLAFSRAGFLLMALLLGGDYAGGVKGCGAVTAFGLARCGFGERLYKACHELDGESLRCFITMWLEEMCNELRTNSQGRLQQRNYTAANHLDEATFPSNEIINLYINPITSFSPGQGGVSLSNWTLSEPNISAIALTAFQHLGSNFRKEDEILRRFHSNVWPGAFKRMLLSPVQLFHPDEQLVETPSSTGIILKVKEASRRTQRQSTIARWFRVSFLTRDLVSTLLKSLTTLELARSAKKKPKSNDDLSTVTIWVPAPFLSPLIRSLKKGRTVPKRIQRVKNATRSSPESASSTHKATRLKTQSILDILDTELTPEALQPHAESSSMAASRQQDMPSTPSQPHTASESSSMGASPQWHTHSPFPSLGDGPSAPCPPPIRQNLGFIDLTVETDDSNSDSASNVPAVPAPLVHRHLGLLDLTTDSDISWVEDSENVIYIMDDD